ncbi:MAG: DNA repair protein RecN [Deltaproteobacteria bacterium]|nr:DNA repair protein RecN [Deltaproteobacteria bacterium]
MLLSLQVRDLAIIDEVEVAFGAGLNVVTGETGAGKSILVDALTTVLGARTSATEVVRTGAREAEITAVFSARGDDPRRLRFEEAGIAWDEELVVRRIVGNERTGGRSRAYLNGRMVSLAQLAALTAGLADVTSQHDQQTLTDPTQHLALLDASAQLDGPRTAMQRAHAGFAEATAALERVLQDIRQRADREDLLRYQIKEIDELPLSPGVEEQWGLTRDRLRHAARLAEGSAAAEDALYARDGAVLEELSGARDSLAKLVSFDPALQGPLDLVAQAHTLVQEAARELGRYARSVRADPEGLAEVEDHLQKLGRLKRKYGSTVEEIISFRARAKEQLANIEQGEARVAALEAAVESARVNAAKEARALSAARRAAAGRLGESISRELASLSMGGARVVVDVAHNPPGSADLSVDGARLLATGIDRVEFLIAANRGEDPRPLRRIASGGELSRALLAIKRVLTDVANETFYVFDEVDAGVGGAVAEVIGQKIKEVARRNQVLCITHLPQIAAYGDRHFVVRKRELGERTASSITELDETARLEEIARMLGGIRITERTREVAAEMIRGAVAVNGG